MDIFSDCDKTLVAVDGRLIRQFPRVLNKYRIGDFVQIEGLDFLKAPEYTKTETVSGLYALTRMKEAPAVPGLLVITLERTQQNTFLSHQSLPDGWDPELSGEVREALVGKRFSLEDRVPNGSTELLGSADYEGAPVRHQY